MKLLQLLPVHGFVLSGGKSSRMGEDKATLRFGTRTLVEIAVAKLRSFCQEVSIAGNRDDLDRFAPVVHEARVDEGPAAGLEAGLQQTRLSWALFVPVDVPLVSASLLHVWADTVVARTAFGVRLSYLEVLGKPQPAFCLLHKEATGPLTAILNTGERRVRGVLDGVAAILGKEALWAVAAEGITPDGRSAAALRGDFANLNTPDDLESALSATGDAERNL